MLQFILGGTCGLVLGAVLTLAGLAYAAGRIIRHLARGF